MTAPAVHPHLPGWQANVGTPVRLDLAPPLARPVAGLTVLCWNLAIGTARLAEVLDRLREGGFGGLGPDPDRPLVVLAQEAYRADESVPEQCVGRAHGGRLRVCERQDISACAHAHGMSLRYTPSMRNGLQRSDRGNAVLSSVAFARDWSFTLPYVRQHRVAVAVRLAGIDDLVLVSAHLDTGGRLRHEARRGTIGGGRAAQAAALARELDTVAAHAGVLLGADLNTPLGVRDPAVLALLRAGLQLATRHGDWWHTFHGPLRLQLDHVLFRAGRDRITGVQLFRLDEAPGDRARRVFGSDHHPLLARVELRRGDDARTLAAADADPRAVP